MMKAMPRIAILALVLACTSVLGEDGGKPTWRVRPIQIVSSDHLPEELPFELVPEFFRQGHFHIRYLIEGQGILCLGHLSIDSIKTPEGRDISRQPSGAPAYHVEPSPGISTSGDGKFCVFTLTVQQNEFGKVERLSINGHVTVLLSKEPTQQRLDLDPADRKPSKIRAVLGSAGTWNRGHVSSCPGIRRTDHGD